MREVVSTVPTSEFHQIAQDFKAPWSPDRGWAFTGTINYRHSANILTNYKRLFFCMLKAFIFSVSGKTVLLFQ